MEIYKKMYYELFNQVSEIIELLQKAQQKTEEIYINADTSEVEFDFEEIN